jgi:tetratricopeptide repeat protein 30
LPEGKATETVYGLIRDGKHDVCVEMLTAELADAPTSRPALSILGHCHYHLGEFDLAAQMYERLSRLRPEDASVKLYHAQSLFKAGARADAARAAKSVDDPNLETQVARLLAHIAFEEDEVAECRAYLAKCPADDPDVLVDGACCDLKDGRHDAARAGFENARVAGGYQPDVAYNEALCAYRARRYGPCLKHLAEIIERGVREHPELLVGAVTEGEDAPSVGNTPALRATFLVEAFNLKAAVEFAMKNHDEAREALTDMPPRAEEELDPVTLHNVALMHMDTDPADGFDKLNFLVSSPRTSWRSTPCWQRSTSPRTRTSTWTP